MSFPTRIGVQLQPQHSPNYGHLRDAVRRCEDMGVDVAFNWDHFYPLYGDPDGAHYECWTMLGAWAEQTSRIEIGPCAGGPRQQLRGMNQFHLGGTLTETGSPPPATRGPGYGAWRFNRATQRYEARMQFLRYLPDGSFDGVSDVHRQIRLSADGNAFVDEIVARLLNVDDSVRVELCGTAQAQRVPIL